MDRLLGPSSVAIACFFAVAAFTTACRTTILAEGTRPPAQVPEDGRPPAAAFFRNPLLSHVALSPDGEHIAALLERDGREMVIVRGSRSGEPRALTGLERKRRRASWTIRQLGWGSDRRILLSVGLPNPNAHRINARMSRLMLVELDGGPARYLGKRWPYQRFSGHQDAIIHWLPRDPDNVLISLWLPGDRGAAARHVNLTNGSLDRVAGPEVGSTWWAADHRGQVRAGGGEPRTGTETFIVARSSVEEDFIEIQRRDAYDGEGFRFAGFHPDPELLYVAAPTETGRAGIYTYHLGEQKLMDRVFAHPEVDVTRVTTSAVDGRPIAIPYVTDRPRLHFLDAEAERTWEALSRALPDTHNRFVSSDRDEKLFIVHASSDTVPPRYYLFEREKGVLTLLFTAYPELEDVPLAPMEPVQYTARDGLVIHGYLTLPLEGEPPYPTILLPHGGPWARDVWGWDAQVQYLASRGFAVLQPNFRGSTGYGREFFERGVGSWGEAMQDDITDGARWLVDRGIADRDRIGIYGASYGGYAALQAMIREPELFRAGASLAGVTDLLGLLADDGNYWSLQDDMERLLGDRWRDRERLRKVSPVENVDAIRGPILIAHGTDDPRVQEKQAHRMVRALEAADVPVESLIYHGEVHGFIDERNRIDFYTRLAEFFERHLAPIEAVQAP